jgi:hypothetical protein
VWAVLAAAVAGGIAPMLVASPASAAAGGAPGDPRLAEMASPSPFRGLVYTGLSLGRKGSECDGAFEAKTTSGTSLGCSHGPDPAPPGTDVRRGRPDGQVTADATGLIGTVVGTGLRLAADVTSAAASLGSVGCIGDGVSGQRVQAIYAVPADRTDRSATVTAAIRATYAPRVDWQFSQSAAETGGAAHVRFLTEPDAAAGCQLSVAVAHVSAAGDDSFSNTVSELKALGYNRSDRKYLVWMDSDVLCGVGSLYSDAKPGPTNINNGYAAMFARVDSGCWNYAEGHELMHTLGAVQAGAPHATTNGHCWDEPDEMCYDDGSGQPMVTVCAAVRNGALFDCNHDDYFYAGIPPATNWLAGHWNTWNSSWLLQSALSATATIPTAGTSPPTSSGTTTSPTGGTGQGTTGPTGVSPQPTPPVSPQPTPPVSPTPVRHSSGYWMLAADGHVYPFGGAGYFGQSAPLPRGVRAVRLEPTPSGNGYWTLDSAGGVRAFGDAAGFGGVDPGRLAGGETAVSLSATPSGAGYWVFTSRGRAVPFGDAGFFGDASGIRLNRAIIGSVTTPTGLGYYLFASDGGIFTFGDAAFHGSTGNIRLNQPVVAMAPGTDGGYWLVASDGGVFAFGTAGFYGSMGNVRLNRPVSAVVPGQAGYLMVGEDGGAFSFGDVSFFGSLGKNPPPSPVVSVALQTS